MDGDVNISYEGNPTLINIFLLTKNYTIPPHIHTIGSDCFKHINWLIENVTFPDGNLSAIEERAFSHCHKIKTINLSKCSNLFSIKRNAFCGCRHLQTITFPKSLTTIENRVFDGCRSLNQIIQFIDNDLNFIGSDAFIFTNITDFYIGPNLKIVGARLFFATPLDDVQIHPQNKYFEKKGIFIYNKDRIIHCFYKNQKVIKFPPETMFIDEFVLACIQNVTTVILPELITSVTEHLFFNSHIPHFLFPEQNNITIIEGESFALNYEIKTIDLRNCSKLFHISYRSFFNCKNLTEVYLPESISILNNDCFGNTSLILLECSFKNLTRICDEAFVNTSLNDFSIGPIVEQIDINPFINTSITEFQVHPENQNYQQSEGVLFSAFYSILVFYPPNKPNETYTIPNSVTMIRMYAFSGAKYLRSLIMPTNLKSLMIKAIAHCLVRSLVIPPSLEFLSESAFENNFNLKSAKIYGKIKAVSKKCFSGCVSLRNVFLGESIAYIRKNAFENCQSLECICAFGLNHKFLEDRIENLIKDNCTFWDCDEIFESRGESDINLFVI